MKIILSCRDRQQDEPQRWKLYHLRLFFLVPTMATSTSTSAPTLSRTDLGILQQLNFTAKTIIRRELMQNCAISFRGSDDPIFDKIFETIETLTSLVVNYVDYDKERMDTIAVQAAQDEVKRKKTIQGIEHRRFYDSPPEVLRRDKQQRKLARDFNLLRDFEPPSYPEEENVYPVYDYSFDRSGHGNRDGSSSSREFDREITGIADDIPQYGFSTRISEKCWSCGGPVLNGVRSVCNKCQFEFQLDADENERQIKLETSHLARLAERVDLSREKVVKRSPYHLRPQKSEKPRTPQASQTVPPIRGTKRKQEETIKSSASIDDGDERLNKRQIFR